METTQKEAFKVIGITIKTTNQNNQAATDIPKLWERFMSEEIASKIPNKIDQAVLAIYTNYEGDHTQPYDMILGCHVANLKEIPDGMVGQKFEKSTYGKYVAKGNLLQGVVYNKWLEIWNQNLDRTYLADFEVYDDKSKNMEDAEVAIFIGVR